MTNTSADATVAETNEPDPRRWLALGVIAIAQLVVVLDATVVNIALPSAQADLGISDANRQWVVTAYTLAFGGLLLLGGRIADYSGRKRMLIVGLIGFAAASGLGGAAPNEALLYAARALQGAFAALLAPAALSLITVTFTEAKERARAFGVFGAISGGGAAIGLVLGGILTEYASWRWCLYINIPICLFAAAMAVPFVHESKAHGDTRYDIPGAITSTLGLVALVYGISKAGEPGVGWGSTSTVTFFVIAAVMLVAFFVIEAKSKNPLLPLRVLQDRNRGGSFAAMLLVGAGLFAMFLFLTYYFQGVLGFTPLKSGVLFLPFAGGIVVGAGIASQMLPKIGARPLASTGLIMAVIGALLLTQLPTTSSFVVHVLPAELLLSIGMGFAFVSLSSTALFGVRDHDAGVASALLNTCQQIGGSLGTALLNTIAATATANYFLSNPPVNGDTRAGLVHGFSVAFVWSAALMAAGAVIVLVALKVNKEDLVTEDGEQFHMV